VKDLFQAARYLLFDLASALLLFALYGLSHNMMLAVGCALMLALAQIGWELARRKPVHSLQWISLVTVAAGGLGALKTGNPLFVMLQPSAVYLLTGAAMLKRGWMMRYLPPRAVEYVPDLGVGFGYVWAGLMFFSAALNLVLALRLSVTDWGAAIATWGIASKTGLFVTQYGVMKAIGRRRYRARPAPA
jgi:intracellular septation protein